MKTYEPKVMRCMFDKKTLEEKKKWQIKSAKMQAQKALQDMIYKEINNSLYSKDDCFVFCYFGETELYKRPDDDDLLIKDFIYNFAILAIEEVPSARSFSHLIKKKYLNQGIAIKKQNTGIYNVPYNFLKFLQETSTLNFKNYGFDFEN